MSKEFLDIQATIECGFTLKRVRDMTKTQSKMELFTKIVNDVENVLNTPQLYEKTLKRKFMTSKKRLMVRRIRLQHCYCNFSREFSTWIRLFLKQFMG